MIPSTIGVDISKDFLDAHRLPDGVSMRFENSKAGYRTLILWLSETPVGRIVYEPTRSLSPRFRAGAGKRGASPKRPQAGAKTDRVDALMLARMGMALELEVRPVSSEELNRLKDLHVARQALVKDRTAAKNRGKNLTLPLLKRQNTQRLKQIDAQIAAIEAEIKASIASDQNLAERLAIPASPQSPPLPCSSKWPELGTMEGKQAASLAGLAPVARQSRRWTGRAFIRGGRASLRQALYMPALVAARFNPQLKAKYRQMLEAGKPPKIAITAIMRMLIILANALLRDNRKWRQNPAGAKRIL
jgi:transposase